MFPSTKELEDCSPRSSRPSLNEGQHLHLHEPGGNIKADKEKSAEKIDDAAVAIIGLDRAIRCGNQSTESVYDRRAFSSFE